jgi:uncharacterized protein YlzI (FlbEa/FlbD family)
MPLVKLSRINKGGEILVNSDHIVFVEVEGKSTTLHLTGGLLFSVEESPDEVAGRIEELAVTRIANGIMESGVAAKP